MWHGYKLNPTLFKTFSLDSDKLVTAGGNCWDVFPLVPSPVSPLPTRSISIPRIKQRLVMLTHSVLNRILTDKYTWIRFFHIRHPTLQRKDDKSVNSNDDDNYDNNHYNKRHWTVYLTLLRGAQCNKHQSTSTCWDWYKEESTKMLRVHD